MPHLNSLKEVGPPNHDRKGYLNCWKRFQPLAPSCVFALHVIEARIERVLLVCVCVWITSQVVGLSLTNSRNSGKCKFDRLWKLRP
jgi:hypothetical protein